MKIPFTGGCSCGAIRYECTAEPTMMLKCHCRDCQQVSGGGFAAAVLVPAESFRLMRGQLRYYFTSSIRRGKHKRGFCPECGSRITGAEFEAGESPFVGVLAASLDDPSWFQPQMDIFVSDAQTWDQMDPAIPKFEQYPPIPTKKKKQNAKNYAIFVVRRPSRASSEILHFDFQKFDGRKNSPLRRGSSQSLGKRPAGGIG